MSGREAEEGTPGREGTDGRGARRKVGIEVLEKKGHEGAEDSIAYMLELLVVIRAAVEVESLRMPHSLVGAAVGCDRAR